MTGRMGMALAAMLLVAACGGGGGDGGGTSVTPTTSATAGAGGGTATGGTSATNASCSLRARQDWAAAQLREWYLFPDLLATGVDPARYASVDDYVDALTAPARAQRRDRYFTYLTSIREEDAYFDDGVSEGFGFQLEPQSLAIAVREVYEGTPAAAAGMDRGTRITAIGTSEASAREVSAIMAEGGPAALAAALGTGAAGETRFFRYTRRGSGVVLTTTLTTARYRLDPVSPIYGVQIIDGYPRIVPGPNGSITSVIDRVGYLNLRTFVSTADGPLRAAFARFRAAGITDLIVDLRYNGGGLVSTAELLADLIAGTRTASDVQGRTTYRPEKSSADRTRFFAPQPESAPLTRVAFLTTRETASASELVINAMTPYLRANSILVGRNTFGKPVGQIAVDRTECDDRLRIVAFETRNAAGNGGYFTGLAGSVEASCAADDLPSAPLDGTDALVTSGRLALARHVCSPISAGAASTGGDAAPRSLPPEALRARHPNAAQRHIAGLF